MARFIAHRGWLEGGRFNNVVLSEEAIHQAMEQLNDAHVYLTPDKKERVGDVSTDVVQGVVYVDMYDEFVLSDSQRPAMIVHAIGSDYEGAGDPLIEVEEVRQADLFLTDDENGCSFEAVPDAPV